jgi:membrane protein DedA with SNARE-associated domain
MSQSGPSEHIEPSDRLFENAAEVVAGQARSPVDRFVLRTTGWFAEHTTVRLIVAVSGIILALTPGLILLLFPDITDGLTGLSYAGVFLMNLASTATFYFPVPGLTLAAQTIIATEGDKSGLPWLVAIAGGLGMALGEITAYYAGYLGAEIVRGRDMKGPKRLQPTIERFMRFVSWLMDRWGVATLFVLSAVPNPMFEFAGLTAGSVRMPFRRFIVPVAAGKIVRAMVLAYYGVDAFDWLNGLVPFYD